MTLHGAIVLFAAGAVAGIMNAIAGGGTIVTFPVLVLLGVPPIDANATSTVALLPGTVAGVAGYRRHVHAVWSWIKLLLPASVVGGVAGAALLTLTPARLFEFVVPYLMLFATVLFSMQHVLIRLFGIETQHANRLNRRWLVGTTSFHLLVSIYGGYFGAGIGILMLASLGVLGLQDIHEMNAAKGVLGLVINGVAASYFAFTGLVHVPAALVIAVGGILGGYIGAHAAQRVPQKVVRYAITVIGLVLAGVLFYKRVSGD